MIGTGCIDEIELQGNGAKGGQLVIQGSLVKGCPSLVNVRVSRTASFSERDLPTPVVQAQVFLEDRSGNQLLIPQQEPGVYQMELADTSQLLPVVAGNEYRISVTISENGQFQSSWERIHPVPQADSVSLNIVARESLDFNGQVTTNQYIQYLIHSPLKADGATEKARLRWTFESVYQVLETFVPGPGAGPQTCYVTRGLNLDKVVLFNGNETSSDRLEGYFIVEDEIDYQYGIGFLLRIRQNSLSREAHRYWDQVSQAISLSGGLFEASPGVIEGNMSNVNEPEESVLGYFYASEQQDLVRFVNPVEAGSPAHFCSLPAFDGSDPCLDCQSIIFSTKEQPPDWGQ
ncbi:MAG: hypothetical protein DHS20C17_20440 [Cyclobacteriaceae bacterium]|nr:MAG: hypothetical protein DHS20C17_20440 [Cyclobacteriaceae bacterium]